MDTISDNIQGEQEPRGIIEDARKQIRCNQKIKELWEKPHLKKWILIFIGNTYCFDNIKVTGRWRPLRKVASIASSESVTLTLQEQYIYLAEMVVEPSLKVDSM